MTTLTNERMSLGGGFGTFAMSFDEVVDISRRSGRVDRYGLVDIYARRTILDVLNNRVQSALFAGKIPEAEGSVIKLLMAELGTVTADVAIDALGAQGMLAAEAPSAQQRFLGSHSMHIGGGTDEIQRNAIAERVLGLPREPRPDKEVPFKEQFLRGAQRSGNADER
jgi:alkylation response protein AidB-like acyl-CoA dehydrogenase